MQQPLTLDALPCGQTGIIQSIQPCGAMHERLRDLGFTEDSRVTCLFCAAFGDPRAYRIRNTVIALRNSDAQKVFCIPGGTR